MSPPSKTPSPISRAIPSHLHSSSRRSESSISSANVSSGGSSAVRSAFRSARNHAGSHSSGNSALHVASCPQFAHRQPREPSSLRM